MGEKVRKSGEMGEQRGWVGRRVGRSKGRRGKGEKQVKPNQCSEMLTQNRR